jgi:hypothetical protein
MSMNKLPNGLQQAVNQLGNDCMDSSAAIEAIHAVHAGHVAALARIAELEVERDEWKRISSAYSPQKELSTALEQAKASGRQARNDRDALRAKHAELLTALHGIGSALGIPEGDRSPYSITCGTLERFNKLAEIEAQEPLFYYRPINGGLYEGPHWAKSICGKMQREERPGEWVPLYDHPVPAQAAPMSDERIDAIADLVIKGMPDGLRGFMRTWGYQQFARALLDVCAGHYRAGPAQAVPKLDSGANYTLHIVADRGYESTITGRCTAEQYGAAIGALHGTNPEAAR